MNNNIDIETFISRKQVAFLKGGDKKTVFKEMVDVLQKLGKIDNAELAFIHVLHRESIENTGIGEGFAIPHARDDSMKELVSIFGICTSAIEYQSLDKKPVRYLLLSLFPAEMSSRYIYLTGMFANLFSNKEKRKLIGEAKTLSQVYMLLKKNYKSYISKESRKADNEKEEYEHLHRIHTYNLDLLIRLDRLLKYSEGKKSNSDIERKIESLEKLIDHKSLAYYKKMRKKGKNPFALLEKTSCTGCNMELAPVYISKMKESGDIIICNYCGRFLITI